MMNNSALKPIPITLNCSGGISLGAYMAGVFYELTKEAVQDHPAILIDMITGASAGAMSGTMAAFHLLHKTPQKKLHNFQDTAFYQAWVKKADIKNIDRFEFPWKIFSKQKPAVWSVLSGDYLKSIAEEVLKIEEININANTQPLALMMTVTNLQGLLKETHLKDINNQPIKSVTSAETRQFLFHPDLSQPLKKIWDKVIISGRASGAFPVAFPPLQDESNQKSVNLHGVVKEYFDPNCPELSPIRTERNGVYHFNFTYTDGGVLDGLPILKGIQLIKDLNSSSSHSQSQELKAFKQHWDDYCQKRETDCASYDNRRYLYIQPQPVEQIKHQKSLTQTHFAMHQVGLKGLTLPKAEHDMLRLNQIEEINHLVKAKEELIQEHGDSLSEEAKRKLDEAIPYIKVNLSRIDPTIIRELEHTKNPDLAKIYSALVNQGQFGKKVSKASSSELLASEFFGAFGGFFDQRYREHDFLLGRISGLTWLHEQCGNVTTPIPTEEIIQEIQSKILEEEPQLKPSHWLRIFRIVFRLLRIYLTEAKVKFPWQIALLLLKVIFIPVLLLLEILISPIIYGIQAMNF
jgi:predicted acylesterase/phospholipase RssA